MIRSASALGAAVAILSASGCSNARQVESSAAQYASATVVSGVYIQDRPPFIGLLLRPDGASIIANASYNAQTNALTGTTVLQHATYNVVGTTLRVIGGEATPALYSMGFDPPSGGGSVSLFQITTNGQVLERQIADGSTIRFIRQ